MFTRHWFQALTMVCALAAPALAHADRDDDGRHATAATLVGASQFDPNQNAYVGPGVLTAGGRAYNVLGASSVLGIRSVAQNGVMTATVSHHFTSLDPGVDIDYYTFDDVTLTPTQTPGLYAMASHMEIAIGRGMIRSGQFDLTGEINLFAGTTRTTSGVGTIEKGGRHGSCDLVQLTATGSLAGRRPTIDGALTIGNQTRAAHVELRRLQQATLPGGLVAYTGEAELETTDRGAQVSLHGDLEITGVPVGPNVYAVFGRIVRTGGGGTIGEVVFGQGSILDGNSQMIQLASSPGRVCGR